MEKTTCLIKAAELIRSGELVAFPTETVYGLGANALDPQAIEKIYAAKGRPASSPLIVHVASIEMARSLVREWLERAEKLAAKFWPGPLTLVLPKLPHVPDRLTAGLPTVGIRMPAHPVAQALIREAGVPIAAPSANPFTALSPTTAQHVRDSLGDRVALVLDGGPSQVGIESTVLSLAGSDAVLLRPGMVTRREIEDVIGPIQLLDHAPTGSHASPGLHARHYSPRTPLILLEPGEAPPSGRGIRLKMPSDPREYAAALYDRLHQADSESWDWIAVEQPPPGEEWTAIRDRLERASTRGN
ncbi:MAG TPA: L-threonylcarbamoyladenylate synthase [Bryobacteraceae bacterium]|nr:L-threonylcarbamoyladenylate synthase [Bryobacteraceae bacterium]